jgi:hypothetical protein
MLRKVLSPHEAFKVFEKWKVEQEALRVVSSSRPPYQFDAVIAEVLTDVEKLILDGCSGSTMDKHWNLKGAKFTCEERIEGPKNTFAIILTVNLKSGELLLFGKHV